MEFGLTKSETKLILNKAGWIETTLGEVAILNYGKSLTSTKRIKGQIPVYGSSGITGWHKEPLINQSGIIIGRKGNVGSVYFSETPFYPIDTVFYITKNDTKCDLNYLYWLLLSINFKDSDSAVPGLNRDEAYSTPIHLPPLDEQKSIADILSAFDDKIELLRNQNKTLESLGQTIFKEWFGKYSVDRPEELPEGWRVGKITEIIKREAVCYKCDKKDLDTNGTTPILDQGITGLYGYTKRNPDLMASKDNPVIVFTNHTCNYWFIDYPFCAIQNVLPFKGQNGYDEYFLYFMTKGSIKFIEYKGHWPNFVAKDFIIPTVDMAKDFSIFAKEILEKISSNTSQIQTLSQSKNKLLTKLFN